MNLQMNRSYFKNTKDTFEEEKKNIQRNTFQQMNCLRGTDVNDKVSFYKLTKRSIMLCSFILKIIF